MVSRKLVCVRASLALLITLVTACAAVDWVAQDLAASEPGSADDSSPAGTAVISDEPQSAPEPAQSSARFRVGELSTPAPTQASATDARYAAPEQPPPQDGSAPAAGELALDIQQADFQGVVPGETSLADVQSSWGEPAAQSNQAGVVRQTYEFDEFLTVEVNFYNSVVRSLVVRLEQHFPPDRVAKELGLAEQEGVELRDELGRAVAMAYPERGVVLAYVADAASTEGPVVGKVVLEPIAAQLFVERAERWLPRDYRRAQRDLGAALQLDQQNGRAHWLRARLYSETGDYAAGLESIERALALEPKNAAYRVTRSSLLAHLGQFGEAASEAKQAMEESQARPHVQAAALVQLAGDLAAGEGRDYPKALELDMQAVRIAEPLSADRRVEVSHGATRALIDAHLAAARHVAWGDWKSKQESVERWLRRGDELANIAIGQGRLDETYRLRVCQEALAAYVGLDGAADPKAWAQRAVTVGQAMVSTCEDPLRRAHLQWDLGAGLYDALQVFHIRDEAPSALEYGLLAAQCLEAGRPARELQPAEAYLLGRVYFRLGSVYAGPREDHRAAVEQFSKAVPLLEQPLPPAAAADKGRHGESFVSMAVSYWAEGQSDEAVRLTRQGAKLMQEAVDDGLLSEDAMAVPYSNLATMLRHLGDEKEADRFAEMATRSEETRSE